jgi:hypothetical protein
VAPGLAGADRLFVLLFLSLALARLGLLVTSQSHANGDDAAIGVMAQSVLAGERPLHPSLADDHAASALAAYLAAGVFAMVGVSEAALKLPALAFGLAALVAVHGLVRSARGSAPALLVALLYGTSVALVKWNLHAPGGYVASHALFAAAFWLLLARATVAGRCRPIHDAALGLLCGLATSHLVLFAPAAATVGAWLACAGANRPLPGRAARFVLAFAAGSLPLALFGRGAAQHGPGAYLTNLGALPLRFAEALALHVPRMLSYDNIERAPPLRLLPNLLAYAVLLAGIALLAACRGPALVARLRRAAPGRPGRRPLEGPLAAYVVAYLVLYALHPWAGGDARHLLPLEPALSILAGLGFWEALSRSTGALARGAAVAVLGAGLANAAAEHVRLARDPAIAGARGPVDATLAPAMAALLERAGVTQLATDDWDLAWRVSFLTRRRIVGCHAASEQRDWLALPERKRARYAVAVLAGSRRDRALARRSQQAGFAVVRHVVGHKALHVFGGEGAAPLGEGWCPPDRLLAPVSLARARAVM